MMMMVLMVTMIIIIINTYNSTYNTVIMIANNDYDYVNNIIIK